MLRALALFALTAALPACDQSTHFRPVRVDGLPACAPPARYYAQPLCIEIEGDNMNGRRVVTQSDVTVDLPDEAGEWFFRVGRCERPRDLSNTHYDCGACVETRVVTRRIRPGRGRRVALPAPATIECLDPS